jgi:hypothetical protein
MAKSAQIWAAGLLAATLIASPATTLAQGSKASAITGADIEALKPGQFIWAPAAAPAGPMVMVVSLDRQQAYVYRNGVRIGVSTVSTGKKGKETPTGVFTILQKKEEHYSNLYNSAPMPFMQRLTWDGIALHAGNLPGKPASHGCIRLPLAFAKALFGETSMGMTVVITDQAPNPSRLNGGDLLAPVAAGGGAVGANMPAERLAPNESYRWQPQLAPSGPVTLLISTQDQRLLVMRNGKAIGRGRIHVPPGKVSGTFALAFTGYDQQNRSEWIYIGVPGSEGRKGQVFDLIHSDDLKMDPAFRQKIREVLTPAVTLVVTDGGIQEGAAGKPVKLLETEVGKS